MQRLDRIPDRQEGQFFGHTGHRGAPIVPGARRGLVDRDVESPQIRPPIFMTGNEVICFVVHGDQHVWR